MSEYIPDSPEIELIDISNHILNSVRTFLRGGNKDYGLLDAQMQASIGRMKELRKILKKGKRTTNIVKVERIGVMTVNVVHGQRIAPGMIMKVNGKGELECINTVIKNE